MEYYIASDGAPQARRCVDDAMRHLRRTLADTEQMTKRRLSLAHLVGVGRFLEVVHYSIAKFRLKETGERIKREHAEGGLSLLLNLLHRDSRLKGFTLRIGSDRGA